MVLVYSIGKSVEGRDLWVTRISKQVKYSHGSRQKRQLLKPLVKIAANIHGNEVSRSWLISESISTWVKIYSGIRPLLSHTFQSNYDRIFLFLCLIRFSKYTINTKLHKELSKKYKTITYVFAWFICLAWAESK